MSSECSLKLVCTCNLLLLSLLLLAASRGCSTSFKQNTQHETTLRHPVVLLQLHSCSCINKMAAATTGNWRQTTFAICIICSLLSLLYDVPHVTVQRRVSYLAYFCPVIVARASFLLLLLLLLLLPPSVSLAGAIMTLPASGCEECAKGLVEETAERGAAGWQCQRHINITSSATFCSCHKTAQQQQQQWEALRKWAQDACEKDNNNCKQLQTTRTTNECYPAAFPAAVAAVAKPAC